MPQNRYRGKLLRLDKKGQEIPEWKLKILEKKAQKNQIQIKSKQQEPNIVKKEIVKIEKKLENQKPKPVKELKQNKITNLIQHYENMISKNKN